MGSSGSSSLVSCPAKPQLASELAFTGWKWDSAVRGLVRATPGAESWGADGGAGRCCWLAPLHLQWDSNSPPEASFPWDRL